MNATKDIPINASPIKIEDMPMAVQPEQVPLIFIDGFQGLSAYNDVVRMNAYQLSQNLDAPEAPPNRVFVARLAMSPTTMVQLMKWLEENVKLMEGEVPVNGERK